MGRNPEGSSNSSRYTNGLSKNESIGDFGQVEASEDDFEKFMLSPKSQPKRSRAIDDGVCYESNGKDNIPDIQENINKLLKVVSQTKEAFEDLSRRLEPVLSPAMKACESPDKECVAKHSELSPLGGELRALTNMVRNLQFEIADISDRIQL